LISILQPLVPHYREEFFNRINKQHATKIFCYESEVSIKDDGFEGSKTQNYSLKSYSIGPFKWFATAPFLAKEVKIMVLMLDFKHLSSWYLLLTKFIHKKKIILWGQGISIKRYEKQEKKSFFPLSLMLKLANGVWFYTNKELDIWKKRIPELNAVALGNTISGIKDILEVDSLSKGQKAILKNKHSINHDKVIIFCARFTATRRTDLLVNLIEKVDPDEIGFIIIGSGPYKPSFSNYNNVYDYGKVYDFSLKKDLFSIADIYFQPAWLGLSIVESMAFGKPIFSFYRSKTVFQCVEYSYVKHGYNGMLFGSSVQLLQKLQNWNSEEIISMGKNAKQFCKTKLSMDNMVFRALSLM
jgi:glycosyltransferase involved in cell wall biosynthesis